MRTIFKYTLNITGIQEVELPIGYKVLSIQMQHDKPQLWAEVDDGKPLRGAIFRCYGTGHPIEHHPDDFDFVDTVQINGGSLIFHFYIGREES